MNYGAVYTPVEFAQFLTKWAINNPNDEVLDLGTGLGSFVFEAHKRLVELGCSAESASQQIYGTEIDDQAWSEFKSLAQKMGFTFPNIVNGDFFSSSIPYVDVVIGNPPYVRRSDIDDIDTIREVVLCDDTVEDISRLTDLYVYFLLHAMQFLRNGGRLAVITADPWLNVGYGKVLKKALIKDFTVEALISIDRPVFADAQVKPVLLLATKSQIVGQNDVEFVRVKNGLPIDQLHMYLHGQVTHHDIQQATIHGSLLKPENTWGIHFKAPELYETIVSHPYFVTVKTVAHTQMGHQTLAKDFFVLNKNQLHEYNIEQEFLQPLAQSAQYLSHPIISDHHEIEFFLFYCSHSKEDLANTQALRYIEAGESAIVPIRGKNQTVVGYHNKQRIQKSSRQNWYDLRSLIEKRGRAEILLPRLFYRNFIVYWNRADYIPGELFIEFTPRNDINPEVYLAILNSSLMEVIFRCHAQVYGGGTYNMNSGAVKNVPIINASLLTADQCSRLSHSYKEFIEDPKLSKKPIDDVIASILRFDQDTTKQVEETRLDLIEIATATKHK